MDVVKNGASGCFQESEACRKSGLCMLGGKHLIAAQAGTLMQRLRARGNREC